MRFERGNAGRPKGAQGKLTVAAKEAFAHAFEGIGGEEALIEWGKENRTEFYKLFARLIPVDNTLSGPNGGPVEWKEYVLRGIAPEDRGNRSTEEGA